MALLTDISKLTSGLPVVGTLTGVVGSVTGIIGALSKLGGIFYGGHKSLTLMTSQERGEHELGNLQKWAAIIQSGKPTKDETVAMATNAYRDVMVGVMEGFEEIKKGIPTVDYTGEYYHYMAQKLIDQGVLKIDAPAATVVVNPDGTKTALNTEGNYTTVIIGLLLLLTGLLFYKLYSKPSYRR